MRTSAEEPQVGGLHHVGPRAASGARNSDASGTPNPVRNSAACEAPSLWGHAPRHCKPDVSGHARDARVRHLEPFSHLGRAEPPPSVSCLGVCIVSCRSRDGLVAPVCTRVGIIASMPERLGACAGYTRGLASEHLGFLTEGGIGTHEIPALCIRAPQRCASSLHLCF